MLNSADLTRSAIGRVESPGTLRSVRPLAVPAITRMGVVRCVRVVRVCRSELSSRSSELRTSAYTATLITLTPSVSYEIAASRSRLIELPVENKPDQQDSADGFEGRQQRLVGDDLEIGGQDGLGRADVLPLMEVPAAQRPEQGLGKAPHAVGQEMAGEGQQVGQAAVKRSRGCSRQPDAAVQQGRVAEEQGGLESVSTKVASGLSIKSGSTAASATSR